MDSFENKKTFFELGIAFARFSAKPDEDEHEIICKVASRLELEIPDYSELLVESVTGGVVTPPSEWFEGSDRESRRNYSRIGTLSFAIFLLAQGGKDIDGNAVLELTALFRSEAISVQVLSNYVIDLRTGNVEGAFRGFLATFSKALEQSAGPSEEKKIVSNSPKVFITYARNDLEAKDRLVTFLTVMKRESIIDIWHDSEVLGGTEWEKEIFCRHLPSSDLLLFIVSPDSLASENCNRELEIALDRTIKIIPIIFTDCDWKKHRLGKFQAFPDNGTPINRWDPEEMGWQNVVEGIRRVVSSM